MMFKGLQNSPHLKQMKQDNYLYMKSILWREINSEKAKQTVKTAVVITLLIVCNIDLWLKQIFTIDTQQGHTNFRCWLFWSEFFICRFGPNKMTRKYQRIMEQCHFYPLGRWRQPGSGKQLGFKKFWNSTWFYEILNTYELSW